MIRFPDQHLSVACLCNLSSANPSGLTRKVAEIYLAKEMKLEEKPREGAAQSVSLTMDQLNSRAGTYLNSDDDQILQLSVQNGKLQLGMGWGEESYEMGRRIIRIEGLKR